MIIQNSDRKKLVLCIFLVILFKFSHGQILSTRTLLAHLATKVEEKQSLTLSDTLLSLLEEHSFGSDDESKLLVLEVKHGENGGAWLYELTPTKRYAICNKLIGFDSHYQAPMIVRCEIELTNKEYAEFFNEIISIKDQLKSQTKDKISSDQGNFYTIIMSSKESIELNYLRGNFMERDQFKLESIRIYLEKLCLEK